MPSEIVDKDLFLKLAEQANLCRVMRLRDEVKLKLRTPRRLYTLRLDEGEAEKIIKGLKCRVIGSIKEKTPKKEDSSPREKQE